MRAFAPGRVNVIGEHTDYNAGLAFAFAIEPGVSVTAIAHAHREITVVADDLGETDTFSLDAIDAAPGWRGYVRGIIAELLGAGVEIRPSAVRVSSDLPREEGLASSAALTVAVACALCGDVPTGDAARIAFAQCCARAEHRWAGAETGLLDQLTILLGREDAAVRIDFADLQTRAVPLQLHGWRWATAASGERRALAESGYNRRRAECAEALRLAGRDTMRALSAAECDSLPQPLRRRVRHVIDENHRVDAMVSCAISERWRDAAALLNESHASLRDLYEVSTPRVDATVAELLEAGAAGARIMGGGFGGSVLALFPPDVPLPSRVRQVRPCAGARMLSAL